MKSFLIALLILTIHFNSITKTQSQILSCLNDLNNLFPLVQSLDLNFSTNGTSGLNSKQNDNYIDLIEEMSTTISNDCGESQSYQSGLQLSQEINHDQFNATRYNITIEKFLETENVLLNQKAELNEFVSSLSIFFKLLPQVTAYLKNLS